MYILARQSVLSVRRELRLFDASRQLLIHKSVQRRQQPSAGVGHPVRRQQSARPPAIVDQRASIRLRYSSPTSRYTSTPEILNA